MVAAGDDGTLWLEGVGRANNLFRSDDGGETWTEATPPAVNGSTLDGFVAAGHGGTVYYANSFLGNLRILRSADGGQTWVPTAPPPVSDPMHRMWLVPTGDATLHVLAEAIPTQDGQVWYMRSPDGGLTWDRVSLVDNRTHFGSDLAVGPDGTLYNVRLHDDYSGEAMEVPPDEPAADGSRDCLAAEESGWYIRVSDDGGTTWDHHTMFGSGGAGCSTLASSWQSLEVDSRGALYFLWSWQRGNTSRITLTVSTDGGETWTHPEPLLEDRGAQALPWFDVRAPGVLDVTWYGADEQGDTEALETAWHGYHARVTGATDPANATAAVTRVTDNPLHQGNICTKGPACGPGEDRSLLDYTWVDVGPDGRAHLAFATTAQGNDLVNPVYVGEATGS